MEKKPIMKRGLQWLRIAWYSYRLQDAKDWAPIWAGYPLWIRKVGCLFLGHKGGGTFGYYRCNRCFGDWG